MSKTWVTAPLIVRTLLVYWHLWPTAFIALFIYFWVASPNGETLEFMLSLWKIEYKATPIALWIGCAIGLVYFLCPIFAWKMLKGKGTSRIFLEVFAWIFLLSSLIDVVFPQIWYFELETIPQEITDTQDEEAVVGMLYVVIDALVLLAMRSKQVREYANVF